MLFENQLKIYPVSELNGIVKISGAKNAALPIMCGSLLLNGSCRLRNIPNLADTRTLLSLFSSLGVKSSYEGDSLVIDSSDFNRTFASYDLMRSMRASILVLGPMLARHGYAEVSLPGGCALGARPLDVHIDGLEAMGAKIEIKYGYIRAVGRLSGAKINLDFASVTGTENLIMAAVLADGETMINNAAQEPEVSNLIDFLNAAGAKIKGKGSSKICIEGVKKLNTDVEFRVISDRIEAGTFLVAVAMCGGDVLVEDARLDHLTIVVDKLRHCGCEVLEDAGGLRVRMGRRAVATDISTQIYPGFPTDLQAQFLTLNTISEGCSVVRENIFENRFMHVPELRRMGAKIRVVDRVATVDGVNHLWGSGVTATDLRASVSLVLAGLKADGETVIDRIHHLDRGYERLEEKFACLGAKIERGKF